MTDILTYATEKVHSKKVTSISRTRKVLQVLQVSANDQNVLVASPGTMPPKKEKALKPAKENLKIPKHNDQGIKGTLPRRSKRKNITSENQDKVASKEVEQSNSKSLKKKIPKASQSKKKVTNAKKLKNEEQVLPRQSSLDSFVLVSPKSSDITAATVSSESNVFSEEKNVTVLSGEPSMRVINSVSDETDMLTSDIPPLQYWISLAEQRRKALEVVNYENARLKDELEALSVENGQLRSLLKEAEKVIEIVNASCA